MNVLIKPSVAKGKINAPPSKSCAHRLLICAALAKGRSIIENIGVNDDITATVNCLRQMGAGIELDGNKAVVDGIDTETIQEKIDLFCNESGSTLRFLIPLSLVFAKEVSFRGSGRLLERPQSVYEELFKEKGCFLKRNGDYLIARGNLTAGTYKVRGDVSSQFLTGLLFTLPLLKGNSKILLTTALESSPYVDITIDILSQFGVVVEKSDDCFFVKGGQHYHPRSLSVEGDWSNGAFLEAFNLIDGNVGVENLNEDSFQGDRIYRDFYRLIKEGSPTLDISDCPDLGPVLMACGALCNGVKLVGTKRLKIKESDRGETMKAELEKFGVDVSVYDDEIIIPKAEIKAPVECVDCHNDHRIAMAMSLVCSRVGGTLAGAQCVNKSYPRYFDDIKSLGIECEII